MKRSTDRILTTHIGSLPRPATLLDAARACASGGGGEQAYARTLHDAVAAVVHRQVETGLDVIDDGEFGKPGFIHYINERLAGFEPSNESGSPFAGSRELRDFPEVYAALARGQPPNPSGAAQHMTCTGPISYQGQELLASDLENLKAASQGLNVTELFMPAVSPTSVEYWQSNQYYRTEEEYLLAIAGALHEEYKAITDAGVVVQIDDPHMSMYYVMRPELTIEEVRKWAAVRVEAINHALKGIPREMVRWHTCYGINIGPRIHDLELKHLVDLILTIDAGAYSFEGANPRHEHEWQIWEDTRLPEGSLLIPGVITQSSVLVEHPELVAQRLVRYANCVGKENLIAGADCGFGTFAGTEEIQERVAWAKLEALVQGARRASAQLW